MTASEPTGRQASRGVDFFGRVTASATHDIKNELAVINEQSHLIQELLEMALRGREVDPDRLSQLIGRVIARVGSADQAVKRLNSFAHSAELDRTSGDARQATELVVRLYRRLAALKGVELELAEPEGGALPLNRPPILFEEALWAALGAAVAACDKGAVLKIGLSGGAGQVKLAVSGPFASQPEPPAADVLAPLEAVAAPTADTLELTIPNPGGVT